VTSGWGRDKNRQRLATLLEGANTALMAARELIQGAGIFPFEQAHELSGKAEKIQEQIAELKRLVKQ